MTDKTYTVTLDVTTSNDVLTSDADVTVEVGRWLEMSVATLAGNLSGNTRISNWKVRPVHEEDDEDDVKGSIPPQIAKAIVHAAVREGREVDFLETMMANGMATVDAVTGKLVLVSSKQLRQMMGRD